MLIVADSSALLALAACDGLALLEALYGEIRVPPAVQRECTVDGKPNSDLLAEFLKRRVATIDLNMYVITAPGLGHGELEAMALYKQLTADLLLLDDSRARRVARVNGISVVGSIGVLLDAKSRGMVPVISPLLKQIRAAGIHLSDALASEALRLADEVD